MDLKFREIYVKRQRFHNSYVKLPNECWKWVRKKDRCGYGTFRSYFNGKSHFMVAHRASYILHYGEGAIPPDKRVLMHLCDNPWCVNPKHLKPGTDAENFSDCKRKGRNFHVYGDMCSFAKLTEAEVVKILHLRSLGVSIGDLSRRFSKVSPSMISMICCNKAWKHVKRPVKRVYVKFNVKFFKLPKKSRKSAL